MAAPTRTSNLLGTESKEITTPSTAAIIQQGLRFLMNIAENEKQNDKEDAPFMDFEEEGQFTSAATVLGLNGAEFNIYRP
jgi:hypothetical protein